MINRNKVLGFALLIGSMGIASGCTSGASPSSPQKAKPSASATATQTVAETPAGATTALAMLSSIPEKGRAPKTGYSRDEFGDRWKDTDNNGCDTRNDILRRDLTDVKAEDGTKDCVVASGTLVDPYSGRTINFTKGEKTSALVQIDHVVALSNAWQTGAQQLSPAERAAFANDPLNLLAVDGELNSQKGDGDAATWLPPRAEYRQAYVARQVQVKAKYRLWMTAAEKEAISKTLSASAEAPKPVPVPTTTSSSAEQGSGNTNSDGTASQKPKPSPGNVYYKNCTAARKAGAAPINRGEPGYRPELDRDNDGIACE